MALDAWSRIIEEQSVIRKREDEEWRIKLGEPFKFLPESEDNRFGVGIFKSSVGGEDCVLMINKMATGYQRHSVVAYPLSLIKLLWQAVNS